MAGIQCTFGQPPGPLHKSTTIYDPPVVPLDNPMAASLKDPFVSTNSFPFPDPGSATLDDSARTLGTDFWNHGTINPGALGSTDGETTLTSTLSPDQTQSEPRAVDTSDSEKQPDPPKPAKSCRTRKSTAAKRASATSRKRALADAKTEEERAKREEMLRKNREAAHKCRAKKKDWMSQMDERHRGLSARNRFLRAELDVLRESVFELKDLMLQHTDCSFAPIEAYLQTAVADVQARVRSRSYPDIQGTTRLSPPREYHGAPRALSATSYSTDMTDYDRMKPHSWTGSYGRSSPGM